MVHRVSARLRRRVIIVTVAALTTGLVPVLTSQAEPIAAPPAADTPPPATAAEAQTAWLAASEKAALLNDQVLQADEDAAAAAVAVAAAAAAVAITTAEAAHAEKISAEAQTVVDSYATRLDSFANASFRGARMSSLSALLTASSADDYLDSVTALDRVAGDNAEMMEQARIAKTAADAAGADLQAKQAQAITTEQTAIAANAAAVGAQASLASAKAAFDAQVTSYEALYNQLSEEERLAALAAEEARFAAAAVAAAAADPTDPVAAALAGTETTEVTLSAEGTNPGAAVPDAPAASPVQAPNAAAQAAVEAALSKIGSPYVWGASGPDAFDCSGLTSWAWKQAGITIPRTSGSQNGLPVVPLDQLQPGDLVTYYSPVSHIAMYIGDGQIVQASTATKPVYVTTIAKGGPNPVGHRVL